MAQATPTPRMQRLIDRISNSRFFTISLILHVLLVAVLGGTVLFQAVQEPSDFEGEGDAFVAESDAGARAPSPTQPAHETTFAVTAPPASANPLSAITALSAQPLDFAMSTMVTPTQQAPSAPTAATAPRPATSSSALSAAEAAAISAFSEGWGGKGRSTGGGQGLRQREFEFVAFLAQYDGGNWDSTVRVTDGQITGGSLPNLLYLISKWSKDKIKTNERKVKALRLDSDEIFAMKPPFILMTGTRDFTLSDKEVENLRRYIRMGGCIWGDSSVPGHRSRFDIAFRREMKRVMPDVDKDFEPLPKDHPIFTKSYYPEIQTVPPGLNFYREPVYAMKIFGEIAILYTANDYADMWQFGLKVDGKFDMSRDARGRYIAMNKGMFDLRGTYLHNIEEKSVQDCFKFGANIIIHLLTRWEDKVRGARSL